MSDDGFGLFGIIGGIILGAAAIAGAIFLAKLAWDAIKGWLNDARDKFPEAETAVLIKERLANGNYSVVAGIFNTIEDEEPLDTKQWETTELDSETREIFGNEDEVWLDLTA
jgi:hypothetical protein